MSSSVKHNDFSNAVNLGTVITRGPTQGRRSYDLNKLGHVIKLLNQRFQLH